MRKVQPFTIGTKLSVPSDHKHHDHIPDLHPLTPSVTSKPGSPSAPPDSPYTLHNEEEEEEEEEEGKLLSYCVSSRFVRKIAICREGAAHAGKSPPSPAQVEVHLSEEEEAVMRSTCEHLSFQQEVNLALEVSLFYQRADIILSDISRTLSQLEDTRQHFHNSEASSQSSEQIDDIAADITVLDRCVHHLSELHPTLTARVRSKQKEVKTCWALLLQKHSMKQSDPPEALYSQFGHRQEVPRPRPEPGLGLGLGLGPEPQRSGPGPGPPGCTTLNKPPPSSGFNQKSGRKTAEKGEKEEECSMTLLGQVTTVKCDEPPDHHAGVTPLASSISVFLTFDPQAEGNQSQVPTESQLTPPSLHLVSRCVQVTGENRETPCSKDLSSGDEPSISSSATTFLPRVSTVVLPPSPSDCSVSTLNLQPVATRRRRGSTHQHTVSKMTGNEEEGKDGGQDEDEDKGQAEGEDEGEYREREASTSRPPVNTELLLYVKKNSVVTIETEDAKDRPEITLGGDDTQVCGDSGKSCYSVTTEFTPSLDPHTYTNDVSNFKSKQDTRSNVEQPPEDSSSSFGPTTISSGPQRPQDQNQGVNHSFSSIRKTSNENSETNEAEDQVKLPGVSSESSSSLHPEEEGLVASFVSTTGENVSYFRSKEDASNCVSSATILYGLHQSQEQNQQIHFLSSTLRRSFSETKDTEHQVKPQGVPSESSFGLHQEEGGLTLSLDLPTDHKDIFDFRSKEDSPDNAISDLNQTQDQKQRDGGSLSTIRKNSEFRDTKNQMKLPGVSSDSSSNLLPKEEGLMLKFDPLRNCKDISNFRSKEDTRASISPTTISPNLHTAPDYYQQADVSSRIIRKTLTDNSVTTALLPEEERLALRFEPTTGDEDMSNVRSRGPNQLRLISSVLSGLHKTQDQNQQADILPSSISKTFTDNSETKESEDQVRFPVIPSDSSSALHQEHGELALRFDKSQDGEGVSHFRSKEDTGSSIIPATVSLDLHRPQDQNQQVNLSSRTIRKTIAENLETKETPDEEKNPGVTLPPSSNLFPEEEGFVLRFDLSSSVIREAFNKNSETKDYENHVKPPGVSLNSLCVLFPEEEDNVHGDLSTLQPSGSSTVLQEDQGNKNGLIIQESMFIQKTEPDSSGPKVVHHQHHCVSVHTKTCDLRGHIYQPITGYVLLSTQRGDERSASMSLRPGLRRSSRVIECLTEGCCICSADLKSRQETESHRRPDPLSPDRWLFDEVEDELEDIWRQTGP